MHLVDYCRWSEAASHVVMTFNALLVLGPVIAACSYIYYSSSSTQKSMAAHRTVCRKMMKFGTHIEDSPIIDHTNFGVSNSTPLAPPTVQTYTYIYANNF